MNPNSKGVKAAPGRAIMAIGSTYWARASDQRTAVRKLRGLGYRGKRIVLFDVPEGAVVNEIGNFQYWPPEGRTWDQIRAEEGKSPPEWANIHQVGEIK